MSSSPSLVGRVILALVLMVGFYALALTLAAALLFLLYAMVVYGPGINYPLCLLRPRGSWLGLVVYHPASRPLRATRTDFEANGTTQIF